MPSDPPSPAPRRPGRGRIRRPTAAVPVQRHRGLGRPAEVTGPDYWLAHMRRPVLFDACAGRLAEAAPAALLELGPDAGLARLAARRLEPGSAATASCLPTVGGDPAPAPAPVRVPAPAPAPARETVHLLRAVGTLWTSGCPVDWTAFHRAQRPRRTTVPGTLPAPTPLAGRAGRYRAARHGTGAARCPRESRLCDCRPATAVPANPVSATPAPRLRPRDPDPATADQSVSGKPLRDWGYLPGWRHTAAVPRRTARTARPAAVRRRPARRGRRQAAHRPRRTPGDRPSRRERPSEPHHYDELLAELAAQGRTRDWWRTCGPSRRRAGPGRWTGRRCGAGSGPGCTACCTWRGPWAHARRPAGPAGGGHPGRAVRARRRPRPPRTRHRGRGGQGDPAGAARRVLHRAGRRALPRRPEPTGGPDRGRTAGPEPATEIAYRGRSGSSAATPAAPGPGRRTARHGDRRVHLVCGGLGGIGLSLAESLAPAPPRWCSPGARRFPPRGVERLSRGPPGGDDTTRLIDRLKRITDQGTAVLVRQADVADEARMREVVTEAEERFGPITGVVHAAGVPDTAGMIQRRDGRATGEVIASRCWAPSCSTACWATANWTSTCCARPSAPCCTS
ncbi:KR domain-containing protein [Streptomyces sp. M19]